MGRPPLKTGVKTAPIVTRLPIDMIAEMDEQIGGSSKRAEFVRGLIEKDLRRVRRAAKRKPDA